VGLYRRDNHCLTANNEMVVCALCRKERELLRSHCIPQSVFELCRDEGLPPIHIVNGKAVITCYEAKARFLCSECEDRFSRFGEKTVVGQCFRKLGAFPFRDKLRKLKPTANLGNSKVYTSKQIPGSDVKGFRYFAASVFWRSSATRWKIAEGRYTNNNLGPKYTEQFRKYLVGESGYPSSAAMTMRIYDDEDLHPFVLWPSVARNHGYHYHVFCIPGIEFCLFVGNALPEEMRRIGLASGVSLIMYLEPFRNTELFGLLRKSIQSADPKGKLKKWLDSRA
jgi:hypothetical protein